MKVRFKIILLFLSAFVLLSYNEDPPNGSTGAPFDGKCSDCHPANNPGGYNGTVEIIGLPDTILPNTTYPLQIKATVTAGNPVRAGFQLVVVDRNNQNAGYLTAPNGESDTEYLDGRQYLDHRGGKYFNGAPVVWHFDWTSPENAACNLIKFYYMVNFCNGGGDFGDYSIARADSVYFAGNPALADTIAPHLTCPMSMSVCAGDTVRYALPIVLDNCDLPGTQVTQISGPPNNSVLPPGSNVLAFQATDQGANTSTCTFEILVYDLPEIKLDSIINDNGSNGVGGIFITVSGGSGSPYAYLWKKDSSLFSSELEDIEYLNAGVYSVEVLDSLGCSVALSGLSVDNLVGLNVIPETLAHPVVLPNPVTGNYFFLSGLQEAPSGIQLINLQGQICHTFPVAAWPGPFFVGEIQSGVYVLSIYATNGAHWQLTFVK